MRVPRITAARHGWAISSARVPSPSTFGRWDHSHLHDIRLSDGREFVLGGHDDLDPPAPDSQAVTLAAAGLEDPGANFTYTFDLGDDWRHDLPFPDWGWGGFQTSTAAWAPSSKS